MVLLKFYKHIGYLLIKIFAIFLFLFLYHSDIFYTISIKLLVLDTVEPI